MGWIDQISKTILEKKLPVTDYLLNISTSGMPLDEIGILIVSRMYDLKVCVLMRDHYWCPLNNSSIDDSEIKIASHGNLRFNDARPKERLLNRCHPPPHHKAKLHLQNTRSLKDQQRSLSPPSAKHNHQKARNMVTQRPPN